MERNKPSLAASARVPPATTKKDFLTITVSAYKARKNCYLNIPTHVILPHWKRFSGKARKNGHIKIEVPLGRVEGNIPLSGLAENPSVVEVVLSRSAGMIRIVRVVSTYTYRQLPLWEEETNPLPTEAAQASAA